MYLHFFVIFFFLLVCLFFILLLFVFSILLPRFKHYNWMWLVTVVSADSDVTFCYHSYHDKTRKGCLLAKKCLDESVKWWNRKRVKWWNTGRCILSRQSQSVTGLGFDTSKCLYIIVYIYISADSAPWKICSQENESGSRGNLEFFWQYQILHFSYESFRLVTGHAGWGQETNWYINWSDYYHNLKYTTCIAPWS